MYNALLTRFSSGNLSTVDALLRIAVAACCAGVAAALFHKLGSGLGTYFFLEWEIPHPEVAAAERLVAYALLALGLSVLVRPHWIALIPVSLILAIEAYVRGYNGGAPFAEWTLWAYALRILPPLALVFILFGSAKQLQTGAWILRVGLSVLFITHGLEALYLHPRFIDFLIGTGENLAGISMTEATAGTLLQIIGIIDIAVAVALLIRPFPGVLFWMTFWGLITALSRVTTFGPGVYYEVLTRAPHFLGPLALVLLIRHLKREQQHPA